MSELCPFTIPNNCQWAILCAVPILFLACYATKLLLRMDCDVKYI